MMRFERVVGLLLIVLGGLLAAVPPQYYPQRVQQMLDSTPLIAQGDVTNTYSRFLEAEHPTFQDDRLMVGRRPNERNVSDAALDELATREEVANVAHRLYARLLIVGIGVAVALVGVLLLIVDAANVRREQDDVLTQRLAELTQRLEALEGDADTPSDDEPAPVDVIIVRSLVAAVPDWELSYKEGAKEVYFAGRGTPPAMHLDAAQKVELTVEGQVVAQAGTDEDGAEAPAEPAAEPTTSTATETEPSVDGVSTAAT